MRIRRELRRDDGAVLVQVAIWLPLAVVLMAFVIDIGNWFEHRRHLQLQADAAVFAAGSAWVWPCDDAASARVEGFARDFAGRHEGHTVPSQNLDIYNDQIGGTATEKLHLVINSDKYWHEGGVNYSDKGKPCDTGANGEDPYFLDVKITEAELPWYFGGSIVPAITSHARIQIQQGSAFTGMTPFAVEDVNPKSGAVLFIDEATKTILARQYIRKVGTSPESNAIWSNAADPASVPIAPETGAVILLSGEEEADLSLDGTLDQVCGQKFAVCYDDDSQEGLQGGLLYVRGYTPAGGIPPIARDVQLLDTDDGGALDGDCSKAGPQAGDGTHTYFFYSKSYGFSGSDNSCTVALRAKLDFAPIDPAKVAVTAKGGECGKNGCKVTRDEPYWRVKIPVTCCRAASRDNQDGLGLNPISLEWEQTKPCVGACLKGSFGVVQRIYSGADEHSGPIQLARIWNYDGSPPFSGLGANSYPVGSTHKLVAEIHLAGAIAVTGDEAAVTLRVASNNRSALNCENNTNARDEVARGCKPLYAKNTRLGAPDPCNPPYPKGKNDVFDPNIPPPPGSPDDCVPVEPGEWAGQFTDGMEARIFGAGDPRTCPTEGPGRNYWEQFPLFPPGDPRIVVLFMVPFGALKGAGADTVVPVSDFGVFYVRGWGGNANRDDPCLPPGEDIPKGFLIGNFIKYTLPNEGGGDGEPCDPADFEPCVPVLVE